MKIKITNEAALIEICKTISWMDLMSQNAECNYNDGNLFREGLELTNCEKILTHWICYITNRQMPFEIVWDKGVRVFSELVSEYSRRNKLTPENILKKYYESYKNKNKKERFRFKSTGGVTFASRYITQDYKNILQTLEVLNHEKYKRNIIAYIVDIIRRFKDKEDLLLRVACGLHLLTYQLMLPLILCQECVTKNYVMSVLLVMVLKKPVFRQKINIARSYYLVVVILLNVVRTIVY